MQVVQESPSKKNVKIQVRSFKKKAVHGCKSILTHFSDIFYNSSYLYPTRIVTQTTRIATCNIGIQCELLKPAQCDTNREPSSASISSEMAESEPSISSLLSGDTEESESQSSEAEPTDTSSWEDCSDS